MGLFVLLPERDTNTNIYTTHVGDPPKKVRETQVAVAQISHPTKLTLYILFFTTMIMTRLIGATDPFVDQLLFQATKPPKGSDQSKTSHLLKNCMFFISPVGFKVGTYHH